MNTDPSTQYSTDGSNAEPGVRISQFVSAFRKNVLGSICDPDYSNVLRAVASKIDELLPQP